MNIFDYHIDDLKLARASVIQEIRENHTGEAIDNSAEMLERYKLVQYYNELIHEYLYSYPYQNVRI